jgi:hypothetical protein
MANRFEGVGIEPFDGQFLSADKPQNQPAAGQGVRGRFRGEQSDGHRRHGRGNGRQGQ